MAETAIAPAENAEVERLRKRVDELLAANNAEVSKRRKFEDEANQSHAESILLRNECIRLREINSALSSFIERIADDIPNDIVQAIDAVFPTEAKGAA